MIHPRNVPNLFRHDIDDKIVHLDICNHVTSSMQGENDIGNQLFQVQGTTCTFPVSIWKGRVSAEPRPFVEFQKGG
jgi:hypothetical protein